MPSFKSKILNFAIRNRHFLQGKLRREVFDSNTSIEGFREQCEKGANARTKIPDNIRVIEETINGVSSEWLIPEGANIESIILYVHGGGYVSGSCNDHRGIVSKFAESCSITALQFEYRLAPEHPFPQGLNDAVTVYRGLLSKNFKPGNIVFVGESAGGGLALAMLLAIREEGMEMPAAAAVISPWTDLTCSGDSYRTKNKVSVAPLNSWFLFRDCYIGDKPADLPLISPLFGDLHGLPPILINSGEEDELFDDGERFYLKAKENCDVTFRAGEGMIHCYPLLSPLFIEAVEAMEEICEFIKKHIGEPEAKVST